LRFNPISPADVEELLERFVEDLRLNAAKLLVKLPAERFNDEAE
jgi:hypothetical protein